MSLNFVQTILSIAQHVTVVISHKTATARLSHFKLDMGVVIKSDRDWHDVGRPSSCNAFALFSFVSVLLGVAINTLHKYIRSFYFRQHGPYHNKTQILNKNIK